jgi:hypothetical protein
MLCSIEKELVKLKISLMKNKKEFNEWFWNQFDQQIDFGEYLRTVHSKKELRKFKIERLFK